MAMSNVGPRVFVCAFVNECEQVHNSAKALMQVIDMCLVRLVCVLCLGYCMLQAQGNWKQGTQV